MGGSSSTFENKENVVSYSFKSQNKPEAWYSSFWIYMCKTAPKVENIFQN